MVVGLLMIVGGIAAGVFGSLLGLGGGVLIVPLLTLGFGLPLREAVGVILVCVIVTSSASAGVYLQRHVANLRLGMTLELFTAIGALVGGLDRVPAVDERSWPACSRSCSSTPRSRWPAARPRRPSRRRPPPTPRPTADRGRRWPTDRRSRARRRRRAALGAGRAAYRRSGSLGAGSSAACSRASSSALLGIGGGLVKVPLMHLVMGVPLRVATATSNLMIGITASASAIMYLLRGGIDPYVAGPTAVGVFIGASLGSRTRATAIDVRGLRVLFVWSCCSRPVEMAAAGARMTRPRPTTARPRRRSPGC